MQIINLEKNNGNVETICYIQIKDMELLNELGIKLNTYEKRSEYLVTRDRTGAKSFVRITNTEDVATIRTNASIIVDYDKFSLIPLRGFKAVLNNYTKVRKGIEKKRKSAIENAALGIKREVRDDEEYSNLNLKMRILNNQVADVADIRNVKYGYNIPAIPEVSSFNGFLAENELMEVYRGLNPYDYFIVSKDGLAFNQAFKNRILDSKVRQVDNYIDSDVVPAFVEETITKDMAKRLAEEENISYSLLYDYKMSDDDKSLIIKVRLLPLIKKDSFSKKNKC